MVCNSKLLFRPSPLPSPRLPGEGVRVEMPLRSGARLGAAGAGFFAAAGAFVHRGPGSSFGFLLARAAFFVAFLDMLGLAFCLLEYADLSPCGMGFSSL